MGSGFDSDSRSGFGSIGSQNDHQKRIKKWRTFVLAGRAFWKTEPVYKKKNTYSYRWSFLFLPKNPFLFSCHLKNAGYGSGSGSAQVWNHFRILQRAWIRIQSQCDRICSIGIHCRGSVTFCYGCGSVPLTNGFGSGSWSRSCYFRQWPSRWQLNFIFLLFTFWTTFTSFFKDKKS